MKTVVVAVALLQTVLSCNQPWYTPWYAGMCTYNTEVPEAGTVDGVKKISDLCASELTTKPTIRSEAENAGLVTVMKQRNIAQAFLGISCSSRWKNWVWDDDQTLVTFNKFADGTSSCTTTVPIAITAATGMWAPATKDQQYVGLCQQPKKNSSFYGYSESNSRDGACDDYLRLPNVADNTPPCYDLNAIAYGWNDAELTCGGNVAHTAIIRNQETNDFYRRTALSAGFSDLLWIGLANATTWVDGTKVTYTNWDTGMPSAAAGDCAALNVKSGKWESVACGATAPFICTRDEFSSANAPMTCNGADVTNTMAPVYSPNFPLDSSVQCEQKLVVPAGKRVGVQIDVLHANECCDVLTFLEGSSGETVLATFTGSNTVYRPHVFTVASSAMRIRWNPSGGGKRRGYQATFWSVDA